VEESPTVAEGAQWRRDVLSRLKDQARSWDLDLLFQTHTFIPRKLLRNVVRELGAGLEGRLLDVGCGLQQYRRYLPCSSYYGLEWSSSRRPTVVGDVTRIPFRDGAFDSALCTEVLEHVREPGQCLAEIRRVLKPGGAVLFTVPMTVYTHAEPYDFYRYTEYGLRYLLDKHGFEISTVRRLGGLVSVMASRGISLACEAVSDRLDKIASERLRDLLLVPFSVSGSIVGYGLSRLLDGVEQRDAIGWATVCHRRPD
jgi:SAM-dependent methyltransferase